MDNFYNIKLTILRSRRKTISCTIKDGAIEVRAPYRMSEAQIKEFLTKHRAWIEKTLQKDRKLKEELETLPALSYNDICELAEKAKEVIPERVRYYAGKIGVTYGSCTAKGNLNFNCLLMLTPSEVLDSIVVHELCHRKHMNHSAEFYAEVLRVYPDYRKWEKWLKENGKRLIAQMGV